MYERLTDRVRKAMRLAAEQAKSLGHEYFGTEHVLLGFLMEGGTAAAMLLQEFGVELEKLEGQIERFAHPGVDVGASGPLPHTPRASEAIERAVELAQSRGDAYVGSLHLLVGMLQDGEALACQILIDLGIHLADLRQAALERIGKEPSGEQLPRREPAAGPVRLGLEVCLEAPPRVLRNGRFGLLMNQASVDHQFRYAHRLLADRFPARLKAIFSPQHGLWGEQQDNMIESPHGRDAALRVPIYSLYSESREPTPEMLAGLDCLVIDLQDVGTRVYTFVWTSLLCLQACAKQGVPVVVLDRPNPLGGEIVEGPLLDPEFRSFVGMASVPMRHALTIGEMMRYLNASLDIGGELIVVPMQGYRRDMRFERTGLTWVPPSPNLPRLEGARVYPGQVLLEGTCLSEGRGTTTPFELFGAPFIDPDVLLAELQRYGLDGVALRPVRFEPTFHKWSGQSCGGLFLHVVDPDAFRPYRTTVAFLAAVRRLWPDDFYWRKPPYEYETEKLPIDILSGSCGLREALDGDLPLTDSRLDELTDPEVAQRWPAIVEPFFLY